MAVWTNVSLSASYVLNDRAVCCKLLFPSALWLGVYGVAWYIRGCKAHVAKNNPLVLLDIDDSDAVSRVLVVGCTSGAQATVCIRFHLAGVILDVPKVAVRVLP